MKIDFSKYDENKVGGFKLVPPGHYLCRVNEISVGSTRSGNEMWSLDLVIEEDGEFYNKHLFDNIVFSEKAMNRAKLIFKSFGVDISAPGDFQPECLENKYAMVRVDGSQKYRDKDGNEKEKAVIGFDGYAQTDFAKLNSSKTEEELPW